MNHKLQQTILQLLLISIVTGCIQKPESVRIAKPITDTSLEIPTALKNEMKGVESLSQNVDGLHTVIVKDVLPASRYVYLRVSESGEEFWIAARKQKIVIGATYYYKRAILKTNFESKEHNKVFEKIYLVSSLVSSNHGNQPNRESPSQYSSEGNITPPPSASNSSEIIQSSGSIRISELIKNAQKYEGKEVQVSGVCVKVNANIMKKNWIHIKDGSQDDYDFIITSEEFVPEGAKVTMKAKVSLNKDFGAGYSYQLILEDGISVK